MSARALPALLALAACSAGTTPGGGGADAPPAEGDGRAPDGALVDGPDPIDAAPPDGPGPDAGPPWLVPPVTSCPALADACVALPAPVTQAFASYRKDVWLPETAYDEEGERPTTGGRMQLAAIASRSGPVTRVTIDGVDAESIYTPVTDPAPGNVPFEWYHVWPRTLTAGEPVWIAFHARRAAWDQRTSVRVRIDTAAGAALDADVPYAITPAPITYVTTTADRRALLVHVRNQDSAPHTVGRLLVGGRDVLGADLACVPARTLGPGQAALWTVPLCEPAPLGSAWTVVVDWTDAPDAVGVGRVLRPFFPVESWNNTSECPFPGGDEAERAQVAGAGIDTIYVHGGTCNQCGCDTRTLLASTLPATPTQHALVASEVLLNLSPPLADTTRVAGVLTGDESDGAYYENGVPVAAGKARKSRDLWARHPELPTYNGGKTNKKVGAFAGMTDIQGMDLYIGACAPHITRWGVHPPLRAPYDYLRNTRDNHLPGPTWLYAQGLSPAWNRDDLLGNEVHVQPDPPEILTQAMMVVAAGAKGFMWFQSNLEEAGLRPDRWQAISDASWLVRGVRHLLREAEPIGATVGAGALAEALRAPGAIVVPVVNLTVADDVTDLECAAAAVSGQYPHWRLGPTTATVAVRVPDDLGVLDVFEVTPTGLAPVTPAIAGRTVTLTVPLDEARPARLFVIARDPGERARVMAGLVRP